MTNLTLVGRNPIIKRSVIEKILGIQFYRSCQYLDFDSLIDSRAERLNTGYATDILAVLDTPAGIDSDQIRRFATEVKAKAVIQINHNRDGWHTISFRDNYCHLHLTNIIKLKVFKKDLAEAVKAKQWPKEFAQI